MKFLHISDLHIGKRINGYSMIEDQKYILNQIIKIVEDERPEGVLIAGDVYDKSVPPTEAVGVLDDFVFNLAEHDTRVYIVAGNHDSVERISFASRLLESGGVYVSRIYDGRVEPITLEDEYGSLNIYLLPFIKPVHVRKAFDDEQIESYTDMMKKAVSEMNADFNQRNILVSHQFVTGASRSDSEERNVGGLDNVDADAFQGFDYVALGHIHGPQNIENGIRYCGTPLKYSLSEVNQQKSVTIVDFGGKGVVDITTVPLKPLRDMRRVEGLFAEVMENAEKDGSSSKDYVHVVLKDEEEIPGAFDNLRKVYSNIMGMEYDNTRTRTTAAVEMAENIEEKSELDLFAELYEAQNNQPMSEEQTAYMEELIDKLKGIQ